MADGTLATTSSSLSGQDSSFSQQGSVDWVSLATTSVSFTVGALSRMSHAGIDPITICAARAMFRAARLQPEGQMRVHEAVNKAVAYPSLSKALWFGFGVKHVTKDLAETSEGLACIGICAALTEMYSKETSARIIRELFLLYNPPVELSPSFRQWLALIDISQGILAPTGFGETLHQLTRMILQYSPPSETRVQAQSAAKVIRTLFDISSGKAQRIHLAGGIDCVWIATAAHWLLGLSVEILDRSGSVVYRPNNISNPEAREAQVVIVQERGPHTPSLSYITLECFVIPTGKLLLNDEPESPTHLNRINCGRLPWDTCLQDVFGSSMEELFSSFAAETGAYLDSTAVLMTYLFNGNPKESLSNYGTKVIPRSLSHFCQRLVPHGRECLLAARLLVSGYGKDSCLTQALKYHDDLPPIEEAVKMHCESVSRLSVHCTCKICDQYPKSPAYHGDRCLVNLVDFILFLVGINSVIQIPDTITLNPTYEGISRIHNIYFRWHGYTRHSDLIRPRLILAALLLGREDEALAFRDPDEWEEYLSAISSNGLCFYYRALCKISTDPCDAHLVNVVPGRILWNGHPYEYIRDIPKIDEMPKNTPEKSWEVQSRRLVRLGEKLVSSTSCDLDGQLLVQESYKDPQCLMADYHITSKSQHGRFIMGVMETGETINKFYSKRKACTGLCSQYADMGALFVGGDGLLTPNMRQWNCDIPFLRVVQHDLLATIAALSDKSCKFFVQGRHDCALCCVGSAIESIRRDIERVRYPNPHVCILRPE